MFAYFPLNGNLIQLRSHFSVRTEEKSLCTICLFQKLGGKSKTRIVDKKFPIMSSLDTLKNKEPIYNK